ncbi:MAG TPA: SCO family protein [Casimicrobiaceae bacterium]|nr:SCO family protein [Casimicrobiaceae bacterium]
MISPRTMSRAGTLRRRCLIGLATLALVACGARGPSFEASDVTGSSFGHDFALKDAKGNTRTLADFRGKAVVVFFGYTQCPDVCPATLATLADAMKQLGSEADRVQVLFITIDPERDTPQLLAQYVPAFDKRFLGLYGDADATARTAKEFKVIYQKVPGPAPGSYTMDHSAGSYVFDPKGRLRLFVSNGQGADVFVHDLRELLNGA